MAQSKQVAQINARKQELTIQLAQARQSMSLGKQELAGRLKFKNMLTRLVSRKPKAIFGSSVVGGLLLTLMLKRRPHKSKKTASSKTTPQILLTWLLSLLKPVAEAWLVTRAKKLASERVIPLGETNKTNDGAVS